MFNYGAVLIWVTIGRWVVGLPLNLLRQKITEVYQVYMLIIKWMPRKNNAVSYDAPLKITLDTGC
jgi:hypothetical protein